MSFTLLVSYDCGATWEEVLFENKKGEKINPTMKTLTSKGEELGGEGFPWYIIDEDEKIRARNERYGRMIDLVVELQAEEQSPCGEGMEHGTMTIAYPVA